MADGLELAIGIEAEKKPYQSTDCQIHHDHVWVIYIHEIYNFLPKLPKPDACSGDDGPSEAGETKARLFLSVAASHSDIQYLMVRMCEYTGVERRREVVVVDGRDCGGNGWSNFCFKHSCGLDRKASQPRSLVFFLPALATEIVQ